MQELLRKSNGTVSPVLASFYAQWRVRCGVVPVLHEDQESPPERLLQTIWQHQRLRRDQLQTLDGQPLRILHPGFRNVESGPDFRGALVQVGDGSPRSGDVEVDIRSSGWHAHGHDRNPAFQNVILHVVWDSERPAADTPPTLLLRPVLDAPLGELSLWLGGEAARSLPEELRGDCCAPLRQLPADQLKDLLHQAAEVRLHSKAAQFQARARQAGWEQSLWEGLFRALGYKHNVWAMQRLAELRPRWHSTRTQLLAVQARLFGISGLLPVELTRAQAGADGYVRRVWDQWWRERDEYSDCLLPRTLWRFHGLRPANHPQRRLALATHWSLADDLASKLEAWCTREVPDSALPGSLLERLQVEPGRLLVLALHVPFRPAQKAAAAARRHARDGFGRKRGLAVALGPGGGGRERGRPAHHRASVFRLAAGPRQCRAPPGAATPPWRRHAPRLARRGGPAGPDPDGAGLLRPLELHLRKLQAAHPGKGLDRAAPRNPCLGGS